MTVLGRIDIHYPAGHSETHHLESHALTIGSASGNSIAISDARIAPRHILIGQSDGAIYLSNLAEDHLTTINDTPAPVNEPQRLDDVAQIRAGDLFIIFNRSIDEPTVAMDPLTDATQPTAAGFRAELESDVLQVWQYSSASIELSVTNLAADEVLFRLDTSGLPSKWTSPESLVFSLASGEAVDLMLQIKPTRADGCAPGEYPLIISISRLDGEAGSLNLVLLVRLGIVAGLSAALDPPRLGPGSPFNLRLRNLGNEDATLRLRAHDSDRALSIKLRQEAVRLSAGEQATVSGIAEPRRRPFLGKRADISFAVLAEAQAPYNYVLALSASLTVKPVLGRRALITAALALAAFIVALAALLYQAPQPEIASFTAAEAIVARGTPVELSWSAEQAQRFVIEVNRAPIAELPADASSYVLNTHGYDEPIAIDLIALNGDAAESMSLRLDVYQPLNVIQFAVDKTSLPRGIPSELTITWRVEGAAALDIALPAGFETIRETIAGDEGLIVIVGAAADDFQIMLSAEDEIEGRLSRALPIAIREPECTPIEDTPLYAGPDSRFKRAGYAVENVTVLATGINAAGDWLQIELASGERGWGSPGSFRCHGFAPSSLNVISDIPQLPTPTPAPTIPNP